MSPRTLPVAAASLVACAASLAARAQIPSRRAVFGPAAAPAAAAPALLPRSVRVTRSGEVIRVRPDASAARRGTAEAGSMLPALQWTQGPGCRTRWYRVAPAAWICGDEVEASTEAPSAQPQPVVPEGEVVPYPYGFAAYSGVPTFRRLEDVTADDWAEQLEQGMGVAVNATARFEGRGYSHTVGGRWVATRDLHFARPSEREGVRYEASEPLQGVAFVRVRSAAWATADDAARARGRAPGLLLARAWVHVREEQMVRGRRFVRTDAGWVSAGAVTVPDVPAPPAGLSANEHWVDVDTARQVLVAYEGARPVMATLVSTGRAGHATHAGSFRVWVRLASSNMSNADNLDLETGTPVYSVERVPWVMYFNGDQALHGVYWHDRFGTRRSHGCVNLAPRDARWLFQWAAPAMPPGWNAVFPTSEEPGMLVRVR